MAKQPLRHYLHGDQNENDPEQWFCSRCDAFVGEAHFFDGYHDRAKLTDHERYVTDRKRLQNQLRNSPGKWRRPKNPPNCLA